MITNIRLRNFRGFQQEISVRVRPITILVGRNSAGKSSLIKFLLMLRQTLESQQDEFFVADGKYVQLGNWLELRNSCSRERQLQYEIEIKTSALPDQLIQQLWQNVSKANLVSEIDNKTRFFVELDKRPVSRISQMATFHIGGRVRYAKRFQYGRHEVSGLVEDKIIFKKVSTNLQNTGFLRFSRRTDSLNDLIETVASEQFIERLRYEFTSLRHLSPVREESLNTIQAGSPPPLDVGDRGEYAIPHLVRIFRDDAFQEETEFITRFASQITDVEEITFKSQLARLSTLVKATNKQTQSVSYLADFGFGVSQCLPIFIQGVMHDQDQLLLVEQPEAQLHPTAQLELGSFFAELWNQRRVPTIIETHSANILLRLRRLVKEGKLSPENISVAFFTVENVNSVPTVVVKNIDINSDGSLEKGLPMEFFGADIIETIEMGA